MDAIVFKKNKQLDKNIEKENSFEKYLHTQQKKLTNPKIKNQKMNLIKPNNNPYPLNLKFISSYQNFSPPSKTCLSDKNITESNIDSKSKNLITNYTYNNNFRPYKTISIEEKISKALENKKNLSLRKNEETLEKFYQKENKYKKIKENMMKLKMKNYKLNYKSNYMKELRLKIYNILNKGRKEICHDYKIKNNDFNMKFVEHLKGNFNMKKTINYHQNFHFDKNDNGESHNKLKMIIDLDSIKFNENDTLNLLKQKLTEQEKKILFDQPNYFLNSNLKFLEFKPISLTSRLIKEEKILKSGNKKTRNVMRNKKINNFQLEIKKTEDDSNNNKILKPHLSNKEKNDIKSTLNLIYKDINKTVYNYRTETFGNTHKNIAKEMHEKIINNMKDELRLKGFKTISQERKDFNQKLKEDFRFHNFLYNNFLGKKNDCSKDKKKKKLVLSDDNLKGQVGQSFNFKNFNKEEIDFVNKYNYMIKTNMTDETE